MWHRVWGVAAWSISLYVSLHVSVIPLQKYRLSQSPSIVSLVFLYSYNDLIKPYEIHFNTHI